MASYHLGMEQTRGTPRQDGNWREGFLARLAYYLGGIGIGFMLLVGFQMAKRQAAQQQAAGVAPAPAPAPSPAPAPAPTTPAQPASK